MVASSIHVGFLLIIPFLEPVLRGPFILICTHHRYEQLSRYVVAAAPQVKLEQIVGLD